MLVQLLDKQRACHQPSFTRLSSKSHLYIASRTRAIMHSKTTSTRGWEGATRGKGHARYQPSIPVSVRLAFPTPKPPPAKPASASGRVLKMDKRSGRRRDTPV